MLEIGYFQSNWTRPLPLYISGLRERPDLFVPEFEFRGLYAVLRTDPVENIWPLFTTIGARFGSGRLTYWESFYNSPLRSRSEAEGFSLLGVDIRLLMEQPIAASMKWGVSMEADYRFISEDNDLVGETPMDISLRITAFIRYQTLFRNRVDEK